MFPSKSTGIHSDPTHFWIDHKFDEPATVDVENLAVGARIKKLQKKVDVATELGDWYARYSATMALPKRVLGIAVVVALVAAVAFYFCLVIGTENLLLLKEKVISFLQNLDIKGASILLGSAAVPLILFTGATLIFHRILTQKDPTTGLSIGKIFGSEHYRTVLMEYYNGKEWKTDWLYADLSTADEGKVALYSIMPCVNHYNISFGIILVTPAYLVATEIGHLVYLVRHPTKVIEVVKNMALAPFFATAYMLSSCLSLFVPGGGRKLRGKVEAMWNQNSTRVETVWILNGPQSLFWELVDRGNAPHHTLTGCDQLIGVADYNSKTGNFTAGKSLTRVVVENKKLSSQGGLDYFIYSTTEEITEKIKLLEKQRSLKVVQEES